MLEPLHAMLDNGTCYQNLQLGSNLNASSSATPSFLLYGNGGLSSYQIYIDGVSIGTFNSDGWSNVCINTTSPLTQGSHRLTGTELRPNPANTVYPYDFVVDTTPPAAPSTPMLSSSTDSGTVGDGLTNFKNLKFSGTAEPGISVQVYRGLTLAAGAATDASGNWLATTTSLSSSTYQFQALAIDSAGNKSARSNSTAVTVDLVLPTAAWVAPLDASTVSGSVMLTADAADLTGLWKLDFKVDGVLKKNFTGTPLTTTSFAYAWDSTTVANGAHTLSAIATDLAGNVTTSSETVQVSNGTGPTVPGAPTLASALPSNGSVALAWTAPVSNGGSTITGYTATASPGGATCTSTLLACTIGGLTNGTAYSFTVTATNAVGTGPASNALTATPATVPGAPTLTSATRGDGQIALAWTAPLSNGGSAITGYTATASPGSASCTTVNLGCTLSGLTNGTTFTVTVTATNAVGTGPASNSLTATPATVPGAPTLTSATAGNTSVALGWAAPLSNGGSAITGYTATASPGGATCTTATLGCTVSGLTNGTSYTFTVTATNALGTGYASNPLSATPGAPATAPGAPTLTSATRGDSQVTLAWTAPLSNGGSAITGYTATASPGGAYCTAAGLGCTVSGLANGTTYSFTVTATNAIGTSPASSPMYATPATLPGAPSLTSAARGNGSVALAWTAPLSNGGSAITGYTATATPGGATCTTSTLGCTVTGLTNGTTYTFTVAATNGVGTGSASNSLNATPATTPGAPSLTSATAGNASVALAWAAPLSNGGSAITGYTATASPGGATCTTAALGCTVSGLTNGTTYSFTVTATNGVGTSSASTSLSATPVAPAGVPGAPTLTSATRGNASVALGWTAAAPNGSTITGYTATASPGGATCTTSTFGCTVGGLTNGTTYTFTVKATNGVGTGSPSNSLSATPATTPGTPTLTSASAGNASVALGWAAPASDGGSPITGYTAIASPGGATCTTSTLGCTVTGLSNGTPYTFTVKATNAVGTGSLSNSLGATPAAPLTAPDAPTLTSAAKGDGSVTLAWTAPAYDGGSPVIGYSATGTGGATCTTATLGCTIGGLTNGTTYTFTVRAINAIGTGAASNALSATPMTMPDAPTLMSAEPGNSVTLTWSPPTSNGGSSVTGYRIYRGTTSGETTFLTSVGTVTTYTDETTSYNTTYYFQVSAVTAAGEGSKSNEMSATPVTPPETTPPSTPAAPRSLALGTSQVILNWGESTDNVGVAGYEVLLNGAVVKTVTRSDAEIAGLNPGTSYTFTVRAFDAAGNRSPASTGLSVKTASLSTSTTGTLAGAVLSDTSTPLANAIVKTTSATGTVKSTKSNSTGYWKLSNLPAGTYTVTVTLTGYQTQTFTMALVGGRTILALSDLSR